MNSDSACSRGPECSSQVFFTLSSLQANNKVAVESSRVCGVRVA